MSLNTQGACPQPDHGAFPQRITLELSSHCNLDCTFCPRRFIIQEKGFMDVALAKRLVDEMALHAPVAVVPFFRGESLLHPEWFEVLSYAREKNIGEIQFTTNATLLSPQYTDRILSLDLDFISFSLDTIDPVLYERERRGAKFERTLKNVLHFLERKAERGSTTTVQVSAVETAVHGQGMDAFVRFWKEKVDRVRIYAEHSGDEHPGSIYQLLPDFQNRLPCRKLFTDTVIYWNGDVGLCNHDWNRPSAGPNLGSVKGDTIEKIWQSGPYQEFRRRHMDGDLADMSPCDNCDHWKMFYMPEGFVGRLYER